MLNKHSNIAQKGEVTIKTFNISYLFVRKNNAIEQAILISEIQ